MWKMILLTLLLSLCGLSETVTPSPKITFSQKDGCINDGSFEFCIPAHDENALSQIQQIAPYVTCIPSAGRAKCNPDTQVLCLVETGGLCEGQAMTDDGWQMVNELAKLPFIEKIVPTFYE